MQQSTLSTSQTKGSKRLTFLTFLFLTLLFAGFTNNVKAQGGTCGTSINLTTNTTINDSLTADSIKWYSFVANNNRLIIIENLSPGSIGHIHTINLYGTCGGTYLASTSVTSTNDSILTIIDSTLTIGQTYFISLSNNQTGCERCSKGTATYRFLLEVSKTEINPPISFTACGLNYAIGSVSLDGRGSTATQGIGQPATFALPAIPSGSTVIAAYLYYSIVGIAEFNLTTTNPNTLINPLYTISLKHGSTTLFTTNPTVSSNSQYSCFLTGDDQANYATCWNMSLNSFSTDNFKIQIPLADFTGITTLGGNYTINGLPVYPTAQTILPGGEPPIFQDVSGATLIIIYTDCGSNTKGTFTIQDGIDIRTGLNTIANENLTIPPPVINPSSQNAFLIAADVEDPIHDFYGVAGITGQFGVPAGSNNPAMWNTVIEPSTTFTTSTNNLAYYVQTKNGGQDCYNMVAWGAYYSVLDATCSSNIPVLSGNNIICAGESTILTASGSGTGGTYSWTPSTGLSSTTGTSVTASPTTTTTYTVTYITPEGCKSSPFAITVTVYPDVPPTITIDNSRICLGQSATLTANSSTATSYSWASSSNGGLPLFGSTSATVTVTPTATSTYTVTTTTSEGCTATATALVTVLPLPPTPTLSTPEPLDACGTSMTISVNPVSGYEYSWTINPTSGAPSSGFGYSVTTTDFYPLGGTITFTAIDNPKGGYNCSSSATFTVYPCCNAPDGITIDGPITSSQLRTILTGTTGININNIPGGYSINTTGQIYFNGVLTLNGNLTFSACQHILFGPLASIIVPNGYTLQITQSHLKAGCNYMWQGINLSDINSKVIVNGQSVIEDAINAIVSNNGGLYQISNSTFNKNYISVMVNAYSNHYTGFINSSTISCNQLPSGPPTTLLPPYSGKRSNIGVKITDVTNNNPIVIGDPTVPANTNTFNNMDVGVYSTQSNVSVQNNLFENITYPPVACFLCGIRGVAIFAQNTTKIARNLVVGGGSGAYANTFNNCNTGIETLNGVNLYATNNTFHLTASALGNPTGINVQTQGFLNHDYIKNNNFTSFSTGVNLYNIGTSSTGITNNHFTSILNSSQAIMADGTPSQNAIVNISNNTISNCKIGIHTLGIGSTTGATLTVENNTITMPNALSSGISYGILAKSSDGIIRLNTINRTPTPNPTIANTLLGISAESSPGINIINNFIYRMGSGIRCLGIMNVPAASVLHCNQMIRCYYGVKLDAANIGTQGGVNAPSGNIWVANINPRVYGTSTAYSNLWYFSGSIASNYYPVVNPNIPPFIIPISTSGSANCTFPPPIIIHPVKSLIDIALNHTPYNVLPFAQQYISRQNAYKALLKNDSLMTTGTTSNDSILQTFYDSLAPTNVAKLAQVDSLIADTNMLQAATVNSAIAPQNALEQNQQTAYAIYLNTLGSGLPLDSTSAATLMLIAQQSPLQAGLGVYTAREVLDWDMDDIVADTTEGHHHHSEISTQEANSNPVFKLYPNPNNGNMTLSYSINAGDVASFELYDFTGRKLNSYNLSSGSNTLTISENKLSNGIYFYNIIINNVIAITDKLVIIK